MNAIAQRRLICGALVLALLPLLYFFSEPRYASPTLDGLEGNVERGAYLAHIGGCAGCHTDVAGGGKYLAGGLVIETPFGEFVSPNITPEPEHGIGKWSRADFARALRRGLAPDGHAYYPVFPYPSYAGLVEQDVADIWAFLQQVPAVTQSAREHDIDFPFSQNILMRPWRRLFFKPAAFEPDPEKSENWNRGAYLVTVLVHCGECHTPRNLFGGPKQHRALSGARLEPASERVPAITREALELEGWSPDDLAFALRFGLKPGGDTFKGSMGEVVAYGTSYATNADLAAIAAHLMDD